MDYQFGSSSVPNQFINFKDSHNIANHILSSFRTSLDSSPDPRVVFINQLSYIWTKLIFPFDFSAFYWASRRFRSSRSKNEYFSLDSVID